jgi:hypothetical protein
MLAKIKCPACHTETTMSLIEQPSQNDLLRSYDALLRAIDAEYATVKQWLEVFMATVSIPIYEKRLHDLKLQRFRLWRREAALLAIHVGMDDVFVSHLSEDELRHIQDHKESADLHSTLKGLQRRVAVREIQRQEAEYRAVVRGIDEHIAAVSLREDSDDQLVNLNEQRGRAIKMLEEVEQRLTQLQAEDKEPERTQ